MEEIDDKYNESEESLENEFFEDFKRGKNRKKIIEDYHNKLESLITSYEKSYKKSLILEKAAINRKKKGGKSAERFDSLKVEHFSFDIPFSERLKMKLRLMIFRIGRFYRKTVLRIIPVKLVYWNYKLAFLVKRTYNLLRDLIINLIDKFVHLSKRVYFLIVIGIRDLIKLFLKAIIKFYNSIFKKKGGESTKKEVEKENEQKGKN